MNEIFKIEEMQSISTFIKKNNQTIGFVPTMGFLHEGHISLIKEAARRCDQVIVSIFVNPLQFGPGEDYEFYPRDQEGDKKKCREAGVHYLFIPEAGEIIGEDIATFIKMDEIMDILCGVTRPGHFQGVATIVMKLLNIVEADFLFLGQKDFQQTVIIQKMVKDFFMPVNVVVMPIVREPDGLAMSSRNSYLTLDERKAALVLYQSMKAAEIKFQEGERMAAFLKVMIEDQIKNESLARIDYVRIVHPETLQEAGEIQEKAIILVAVWIGKTRLIDNLKLSAVNA